MESHNAQTGKTSTRSESKEESKTEEIKQQYILMKADELPTMSEHALQ